jgi:hypothetical protein
MTNFPVEAEDAIADSVAYLAATEDALVMRCKI